MLKCAIFIGKQQQSRAPAAAAAAETDCLLASGLAVQTEHCTPRDADDTATRSIQCGKWESFTAFTFTIAHDRQTFVMLMLFCGLENIAVSKHVEQKVQPTNKQEL